MLSVAVPDGYHGRCVRQIGRSAPAAHRARPGVSCRPGRRSAQLLARDRDAVQKAALTVVVVDREVPGRTIVPEGE